MNNHSNHINKINYSSGYSGLLCLLRLRSVTAARNDGTRICKEEIYSCGSATIKNHSCRKTIKCNYKKL